MTKKERDRAYYHKNRERLLFQAKEWYRKNRAHVLAVEKARYQRLKAEKPDHLKKLSRRHYYKTRDKALAWHKEHHRKQRIEFLTKLGNCKCARCGFSDWRALQVDHINGGGNKERKEKTYGSKTWNLKKGIFILENRSKYQILCANCNFIKRYENHESAKKRKFPELREIKDTTRQNF